MDFLANENFPKPSILLLRSNGYKVVSICEEFGGISDEQVIQIAQERQLAILTFDSDYGELIIRHGLPNPPDVIYFRYQGPNPIFAGQRLLDIISLGHPKLTCSFTVVEENNLRQRKYLHQS